MLLLCGRRRGARLREITGLHDRDLRRVDVAAQGRGDLLRRQGPDLLLQVLVPGESAREIEVRREKPREPGVLRARDLPRLEPSGPGFVELLRLEAVLQDA